MKMFPASPAWWFGILYISVSLVTNGSSRSVEAFKDEDVILPCHLNLNANPTHLIVEWTRSDPKPGKVHVYKDGNDSFGDQLSDYKGRTSLFKDELKNGNFSLKLFRVTPSDNGDYTCFLPPNGPEENIRLKVDRLSKEQEQTIKEYEITKKGNDKKIEEQENKIAENDKKIKEQENKIEENDKKDKEIGDLKKEIGVIWIVLGSIVALVIIAAAICIWRWCKRPNESRDRLVNCCKKKDMGTEGISLKDKPPVNTDQ